MINSTSSSDRTTPPAVSLEAVRPKVTVRNPVGDQFSADNSAALRVALSKQPEVRPEVVARGRALAADPNYPSAAILRSVGEALIKSPDLSEEPS